MIMPTLSKSVSGILLSVNLVYFEFFRQPLEGVLTVNECLPVAEIEGALVGVLNVFDFKKAFQSCCTSSLKLPRR